MKKSIFTASFLTFIVGFFLTSLSANAQNWLLNGNAGTTTSNYLGTTDNQALSIRTGATQRMRILNNTYGGYVCINPGSLTDAQLQAFGTGVTVGNHLNLISPTNSGYNNQIRFYYTNALRHIIADDGANLLIQPGMGGGATNIVKVAGRLQVGNTNTPAGYSLYVQEGVLANFVKVALLNSASWNDHVFAPEYKLKPLAEVETFVKTNRHLPDVPSADELVKTGIDLGKMDATLLGKIEELYLHTIEQNKKVQALQAKIVTLEASNEQKSIKE